MFSRLLSEQRRSAKTSSSAKKTNVARLLQLHQVGGCTSAERAVGDTRIASTARSNSTAVIGFGHANDTRWYDTVCNTSSSVQFKYQQRRSSQDRPPPAHTCSTRRRFSAKIKHGVGWSTRGWLATFLREGALDVGVPRVSKLPSGPKES